jgi:hypothetical protein
VAVRLELRQKPAVFGLKLLHASSTDSTFSFILE